MIISWKQMFNAEWKLKGETGQAKYEVTVEIEGEEREMMTDAAPMIQEIAALEGKPLSKVVGRSSLEAVVIYLKKIVQKHLEGTPDKLRRLSVLENDMFAAEV